MCERAKRKQRWSQRSRKPNLIELAVAQMTVITTNSSRLRVIAPVCVRACLLHRSRTLLSFVGDDCSLIDSTGGVEFCVRNPLAHALTARGDCFQ